MLCNLSRIPISMCHNPLYLTALQLLDFSSLDVDDSKLYEFYMSRNIKSLGDLFGVSFLQDISYDHIFLPWLHYKPVSKYRDVAFVEFDINEKFMKIKTLMSSIQKHGYFPEKFPDRKGGIVGYYLRHKNIVRPYIVSGNHRVAVLSAMGIPFDIFSENGQSVKDRDKEGVAVSYDNFPKEFSSDTIGLWPSVVSGFLTKDQAFEILNRYLET